MSSYRTASFYRVAAYLRIRGQKRPLGFFRVPSVIPIKEDLESLGIVPTKRGVSYLIHFEDHDCSTLPYELRYVDKLTAKGICQFIIDNAQGPIYVKGEEQITWTDLFNKINYRIEFNGGRLRLGGLDLPAFRRPFNETRHA